MKCKERKKRKERENDERTRNERRIKVIEKNEGCREGKNHSENVVEKLLSRKHC